jgi:tetratricopeptide (TPR) repeat protein
MNLLFDFLKNLPDAELRKVKAMPLKGTTGKVFDAMVAQAAKGTFDREAIQKQTGVSDSHFDKITSELLSKCYKALFPAEGLDLLNFLSQRIAFNKHYYKELPRQLKHADKIADRKARAVFYKGCIDHHQFNLPIMYKDVKVLAKLGEKYITLVDASEKKNAKLIVQCRLLFNKIDNLFAAATIKDTEGKILQEFTKLGKPEDIKGHEPLFEYYWLKVYYYLAIEDFAEAIEVAKEAIAALHKWPHPQSALNILRLELKLSELYYFSNRFEESFEKYRSVFNGPHADIIPERGYHTTKYVQICCITYHLKEAKAILDKMRAFYGDKLQQSLPVRDVFSFIKYYLFAGEYDNAFEYLQLGFQKNPKARYFQYEIELRNLQVALFYLTGKRAMALQMCERNIKYLRSHGYSVKESNYPYFYILTRAIFEQSTTGRKFKAIEEEKMERYLRGSFGVYGRLLQKMQKV